MVEERRNNPENPSPFLRIQKILRHLRTKWSNPENPSSLWRQTALRLCEGEAWNNPKTS